MRKLAVLAAAASVFIGTSAHAALLAYEGFDYTTGTIAGKNGGTGFAEAWGSISGGGNINVVTTQLNYTDGNSNALDTLGNSVYIDRSTRSVSRLLDQTYSSGVVWLSFLIQPNSAIFGSDPQNTGSSFRLVLLSGTTERLQAGNRNNSSTVYGISGFSQTGNSTVSVLGNTDVQFMVVRYEFGAAGSVHLFMNPDLDTEPALVDADAALTGIAAAMSFNTIRLQTLAADISTETSRSRGRFDEIRLGETYFDVTAIPEPASLSLLGLGGIALLRRRRQS